MLVTVSAMSDAIPVWPRECPRKFPEGRWRRSNLGPGFLWG